MTNGQPRRGGRTWTRALFRVFVIVIVAGSGAAELPACNGNSDLAKGCRERDLVKMAMTSGLVSVSTCAPGYAHPNICCKSGPMQPTACTQCAQTPFAPCDKGALTFPDPYSCCALDGGGCNVTKPGTTKNEGSCTFPCGPGGYFPEALGDAAIHFEPFCPDVDGSLCTYCCFDQKNNLGNSDPVCAGGNLCTLEISGPCGPTCSSCPAGWDVPPHGQFDLCCRMGGDGKSQCFSQATTCSPFPDCALFSP
jgi:hypothetical protein